MNEEQKDINEFDELFKANDIKPKPEEHKNVTPYFLAIMYYLLIMLVVSTIIGVVFLSVPDFRKDLDQNDLLIREVISDASVIALLPTDVYQTYASDYESHISYLGDYHGFSPLYQDYAVLISVENYEGYAYLTNGMDQLDVTRLEIILSGTKTTWDSLQRFDIKVFESSLHPIPLAGSPVEVNTITDTSIDLSGLASALWNFTVYLALTPILALVILKRDITADLLVYKKRWNEFIPAVLIGYALVLAGNFVANFASSLIGSFLGHMSTTAANQLSIEQTLQSNGVVLMFLSAVILGPIAEELVFRRSIFSIIKNDIAALIVSALAFGSIHLLNESSLTGVLVNGVVYIFLGFVFGYIYIRNKKNIAVVITVHMISNLVSVLMAILLI